MTDLTDPQATTQTCPHGKCGHVTIVVPDGKRGGDDLAVGEIDIASRKLGSSAMAAAGDPDHMLHFAALIQFAWLWSMRTDPRSKVEPFKLMTLDELHHTLGIHRPTETAGDDGQGEQGEDPTSPPTEPNAPS